MTVVACAGVAVGDGMDGDAGGEVELEQAIATTTVAAANMAPNVTVRTSEIIDGMIPERPAC